MVANNSVNTDKSWSSGESFRIPSFEENKKSDKKIIFLRSFVIVRLTMVVATRTTEMFHRCRMILLFNLINWLEALRIVRRIYFKAESNCYQNLSAGISSENFSNSQSTSIRLRIVFLRPMNFKREVFSHLDLRDLDGSTSQTVNVFFG